MRISFIIYSIILPVLVFGAQTGTFADFIQSVIINKLITPLTALVVSLIILFFFYNSAIFLFKTGASSQEKEKIINSLIWSIVIMFLLVSVWGLVKLIAGTLTLQTVI